MRRLLRWAFDGLAAVSLLLCAASVALWVRSYRGCDDLGCEWFGVHEGRSAELYTARGRIGIGFAHGIDGQRGLGGDPYDPKGWNFYAQRGRGPPFLPYGRSDWGWHDFVYDGGDDTPGQRFQDVIRIVEFPAWAVVTFWAVAPAWWLARVFRVSRRPRAGCCPACGYNLRATPDRCPECGAVPSQETCQPVRPEIQTDPLP